MNNIRILDCTLRDGGQGLEDAAKNNLPHIYYEEEEICKIIDLYKNSNIEIIELGCLDPDEAKECYCMYGSIEAISKRIPKDRKENQMYVALFKGPDFDLKDIPERKEEYVDGVRVIIRYSELQKSLDFCMGLSKKGYKVFVQPMLTMRYTNEELQHVLLCANKMNAYAVYFVDSYGYMTPSDVKRFYSMYDNCLNESIYIGFHAHNNMDMAVANAIAFIEEKKRNRNIIIDSTSLGIGQGAGNLQTEIITHYLNNNYAKTYNMEAIIGVCSLIEKHNVNALWGYSLNKYIPAKNKVAYKYAVALKNRYHLSNEEIDRILKSVPEELRHRYTIDNTKKLINLIRG